MAITRLAISNPAANTDILLNTADRSSVASVIVTNKGAVSSNIRVWIVPFGQDLTSSAWNYIAYDVPVEAGNSMETFRFPIVASDKIYIRSSTANCSFSLNSLYETNGTSNISVQSAAPAAPQLGDIWIDSDNNYIYFWNDTSWVEATINPSNIVIDGGNPSDTGASIYDGGTP